MISDQTRTLLARIDEATRLINRQRPLSKSIASRLQNQLSIDWTYNSNGIEGNTLTLKETQLVVEHGLTIGGKSFAEHLEAINHRQAISFVEELGSQKGKISERNIREIHSIVLKDIDSDYAGRYRDVQVRITGSKHTPTDPLHIQAAMKSFVNRRLGKSSEHPIVQAALAHHELVFIHPFVDGNGRTARLLMNLILLKNAYPISIILKNDRRKYYNSLELAHKGDVDKFIFFVARSIERTINLYFEAIPKIKTSFLTLKEAAEITSYSQDYLNILARRGNIPAFKLKRNWVINKESLLQYERKQSSKFVKPRKKK